MLRGRYAYSNRWIYCLLWACLLVSSVTSASDSDQRPLVLQLKWFHQFQFAGYYAALEKGFYLDEGLDVEIRERDLTRGPVDDVLDGRADFGISDSSLILHRLRGQPVVALAVIFQSSPLVLMSLENSNISSPMDLVGKRVMYQRDLDDALIMAMFNEVGLDEDDFIYVPHNLDDDALLKDRADAMSAYISDQPFLYRSQGHRVNIINPANYGIDFYGDNLFTSEQMIQNDPETVLAFRRASIKGWQYALENTEEVLSWFTEKYPSQKDYQSLRHEAEISRRMIKPRLVELGEIHPSRFRRIANIYKEREDVPQSATLDGFYYREYFDQNNHQRQKLLQAAVIGVAVIAFAIIAMMIVNHRLKLAVRERTLELSKAKEKIENYVNIVDTHTITSEVDRNLKFTYVSDAFCRISGYPRHELLGSDHTFLSHPDTNSDTADEMMRTIALGEKWYGEFKNQTKGGNAFYVEANVEPILDENGTFDGYTAVRVDITDRKRVEVLAVTDPLTSLYNRMKINSVIQTEISRAKRSQCNFSIILLDVDHFKTINDKHGHQAGDRVLSRIAKLIKNRTREIDTAGRWGGEEFLVLCPETDLEGATKLAENLREEISQCTLKPAKQVTVSLGVAQHRVGETDEQLIERADVALYSAKEAGRNRVRISKG